MNVKEKVDANNPRLNEIAREMKLVPITIQVKPWAEATLNECFNNTRNYAKSLGGTPVYGWLAWSLFNHTVIVLEAHAVIKRQKKIRDISPYLEYDSIDSTRTFLPDPSAKHTEVRIPDRAYAMNPSDPSQIFWAKILSETSQVEAKFFKGTFLVSEINAEIESLCEKYEANFRPFIRTVCWAAINQSIVTH